MLIALALRKVAKFAHPRATTILCVSLLVFAHSALNGNNGEWTNGDDMPPKRGGKTGGEKKPKGKSFIQTMDMGSGGGKNKGGSTATPSDSDIASHPEVSDYPVRGDLDAEHFNNRWHSTQTEGYDLFVDENGEFRSPTDVTNVVMSRYFPGDRLEKTNLSEMSHFKLVREIQECALKLKRDHASMVQAEERHKLEIERARESLPSIAALRESTTLLANQTAKIDEIKIGGELKISELEMKITGDNQKQALVNSGGIDIEMSKRVTSMMVERHKGEIVKHVEALKAKTLLESKTIDGDYALHKVNLENDGKAAVELTKGEFAVRAAGTVAEGNVKAQNARAFGDIISAGIKADGDKAMAETRGKFDLQSAMFRSTCQEASMMAAVTHLVDNHENPMARAAALYEVAQVFKHGVKPEALKYSQIPPKMTPDMHQQYPKLTYGGRLHTPKGIALTRTSDGYVPANCLVRETPWIPGVIGDFKCVQDRIGDWRLENYVAIVAPRPYGDLPIAQGYDNTDLGDDQVTVWKPADEYGAFNIRPQNGNDRRWTHPHHNFIGNKFIYPIPYGNTLNEDTIPIAGCALSEVGIYYSAPDKRTWFEKFAGAILGVCLEHDEDAMNRPVRNYHADLVGGGCKEARILTSRFMGIAVGDYSHWTSSIAGFADVCKYTHTRTALISSEMAQALMGSVDKTGLANSAFDSRFDTVQRAYVPLLQQANNKFGRFFERELIENTCMYLAQTCALKAYVHAQNSGMSGVISRGEFINKPGALT